MHSLNLKSLASKTLLFSAIATATQLSYGDGEASFSEALKASKVTGNFRMRYEELDRATDVDLLTLKSLIGVKTGTYNNFSAVVEVEDE